MNWRLRISARAATQIARAEHWWAQHRDKNPGAFNEDLNATLRRIRANPHAGVRIHESRGEVRTVWAARIGYLVYYRIHGNGIIRILALWHASRGSRPRF